MVIDGPQKILITTSFHKGDREGAANVVFEDGSTCKCNYKRDEFDGSTTIFSKDGKKLKEAKSTPDGTEILDLATG